jgi:hypothetical protein
METNELTGAALDWAVAKCEGTLHDDGSVPDYFQPSVDWEQGGAIIESEEISISREFSSGRVEWAAWTPAPFRDDADAFGHGETPLIAAMRCYVASKLGDEIEVPEELLDFAHE